MSIIHKKLLEFANVIPVAVGGSAALESSKIEELVLKTLPVKLDLIVNTMSFRLSGRTDGRQFGSGNKSATES